MTRRGVVIVVAWACGAAWASAAAAPAARRVPDHQRALALEKIAASGRPETQEMLVVASADGSPLVRQAAMQFIARHVRLPTTRTLAAVRKALADPHPLVVLSAVEALHVHPDAEAVAALGRLVRQPPAFREEHVLARAVNGRARTSRRQIADEALRAIRKTRWPAEASVLVDLLASRHVGARRAAAAAAGQAAAKLAKDRRGAIVAALAAAVTDRDTRVRRAAAEALARLGDGRGAGVLLRQLRGGEAGRQTAAAALEKLAGRDWGASDATFWGARGADATAEIARRIHTIEAHLKSLGYPTAPPEVVPKRLTPADTKLLGRLFELGLVDPRGRRCLSVTRRVRTADGKVRSVAGIVWAAAEAGGREVVREKWGRAVPPGELTVRQAVDDLTGVIAGASMDGGYGRKGQRELILAAWSWRLGRQEQAARLMFAARAGAFDEDELLDRFRRAAAVELLHEAVAAFVARADGQALAAAERLVTVGGRHAETFGSGSALRADLRRRKEAGTFARPAPPLPKGLAGRSAAERVKLLIADLEEVAVRPDERAGGVDLASDGRIAALIEIGDPAVGALIDCIACDERLTRSVHYRSPLLPQRWVLSVREAALVAAQSILRRPFFRPESASDNLTRRGAARAEAIAARMRAYWRRHGGVPLPQRMMDVLTDEDADLREVRTAAQNLATLGVRAVFGTTVGSTRLSGSPRGVSPAAAMFSGPTAAEAIVAAMGRDLAVSDPRPDRPPPRPEALRQVEDIYTTSLMYLGDRRIVGELLRRYRAARSVRRRRLWASSALLLGRPDAMNELAGELKAGKLSLPADARDAAYELHELALYLGVAKTPPCDEALYALADAAHPQHAVVLSRLRAYDLSPGDEAEWFMHPYCLKLLRSELDRTGPDGRAYTVEGDSVVVQSPAGRRAAAMPAVLARAADRSARAAGRQCDAAARLLGALVYGLPEHHPLLRDADRRLTAMRETLDRYPMRLLNGAERRMLRIASPHGVFAPDIRPLKRPATSDDVRAGRAVFHLTGKGRLAPGWKLPAVAAWRGGAAAIARRVIVVQAEIDRAGRVRCGIVAPHEVLAVDAGQLTRQTPQ